MAEEAMFTDEEARLCHNAHGRGERSERVLIGERVYGRRRKREQKERKRARVAA
jgi:hypothetical protein